MQYLCDFHIHSALSPCADPDMTPGNIVGMAKLQGLQAIAITDHQSCGNCAAAIRQSEKTGGPLVVPGLEVESREEIHMICLFPTLAAAQSFCTFVWSGLPMILNRADIFGEQLYFDENDELAGQEDRLLLQACSLGCDELARLALSLDGVCLPAHIDREANSMLTILGQVPPDFPCSWLELSLTADENRFRSRHPELSDYQFFHGSDAHRLADLATAGQLLDISVDLSTSAIIQALRAGLS